MAITTTLMLSTVLKGATAEAFEEYVEEQGKSRSRVAKELLTEALISAGYLEGPATVSKARRGHA
jgi:hypothetical protein